MPSLSAVLLDLVVVGLLVRLPPVVALTPHTPTEDDLPLLESFA